MSDATRQASDALLDLVRKAEGFQRQVITATGVTAIPYLCPAHYWTIGYGHLCLQSTLPITKEQGEAFLLQDVNIATMGLLKLTTATLNPWQRAALTSFVFNLGIGRYKASTLRSVLNRGEYGNVPTELNKWVYGGGRKLPGLVLRRAAEAAMWNRQ